ncbi:MAG TPA: hypothetical protein VJU59_34740 [Paraburkholderia sp.]|uniref:hypothetical protein n=1 Tax=Paraburkholderia sp. TaxID=1926495 RepID=UPI002B480BE4|nr:hypothetical protein [Paraburkholderia sp.]HKR44776.1 hypothetical protein [Paraburkholderia sp.]
MTEPKLDNTLFVHLRSALNQALPLEYALRAARQANPNELEQLSAIGRDIRQYWTDLGASAAQIDAEDLMEFAWDTVQVGFPLTRRHGRRYRDRTFLGIIDRGLAGVREKFGSEVDALRVPATGYFRIVDLLNGNDILKLLNAVVRCLGDAKAYEALDTIELERFVRGIREPVHLHPGMEYVAKTRPDGEREVEQFGVVLDTEMELALPDLMHQIWEFLYQFAVRRESMRPAFVEDRTSHDMIEAFLRAEMFGHVNQRTVKRLDGFVGPLAGLYCWDLVQRYREEKRKSAVDEAIAETLAIYPKGVREVGEDSIRSNYNKARVTIKSVLFGKTDPTKPRNNRRQSPRKPL